MDGERTLAPLVGFHPRIELSRRVLLVKVFAVVLVLAWIATASGCGGRKSESVAVVVPYLVGLKESDARQLAVAAGFRIAIERHPSSIAEPGTVVGQEPASGARLPKGETVTLLVARRS